MRAEAMIQGHPMQIAPQLLRWFEANQRALPWRHEPRDPYHVWLSEVMLQQTQVATATPYFLRWINALPTIAALAKADIDEVLKLWEGLGYYARARNFHKAARIVMEKHAGALPATLDELRSLPGVGPYTASAVASIAFGVRTGAIDGNVKRVLSRLHALLAADDAELAVLAEASLPPEQAGAYNEAMMELGATVCKPRQPLCPACPLKSSCQAYAHGNPMNFPAAKPKARVPTQTWITLVLTRHDGAQRMRRRPMSGLLGGLWEYPSVKVEIHGDAPPASIKTLAWDAGLSIDALLSLGEVRHAFTHFKLSRPVYLALHPTPESLHMSDCVWIAPGDMQHLALTRSDQKICQLVEMAQGASRATKH